MGTVVLREGSTSGCCGSCCGFCNRQQFGGGRPSSRSSLQGLFVPPLNSSWQSTPSDDRSVASAPQGSYFVGKAQLVVKSRFPVTGQGLVTVEEDLKKVRQFGSRLAATRAAVAAQPSPVCCRPMKSPKRSRAPACNRSVSL